MSFPSPRDGWSLGVDTSVAQGRLSVASLVQAGVEFAYHKATDGCEGVVIDKQWQNSSAASRDFGLPFGGYGVLEPHEDPVRQADLYCDAVERSGATLPPMLDFELARGLTGDTAFAKALAWVLHVEKRLRRTVLVYTGPNFVDTLDRFDTPKGHSKLLELAKRPLFVAHYTQSYNHLPDVPHAWGDWLIWQASGGRAVCRNAAQIPHTNCDIDIDWLRGPVSVLVDFGRLE